MPLDLSGVSFEKSPTPTKTTGKLDLSGVDFDKPSSKGGGSSWYEATGISAGKSVTPTVGAHAVGTALAAITPPVLPVVGPFAKPVAYLVGALGGALGIGSAQEKAIEAYNPELARKLSRVQEEHPVASTAGYYNGMAIQFNTVVTSTGIATGRVFWLGDLSGNTFKVYTNPSREATMVVNIATGDGSGTLSSYTFGQPLDSSYGLEESRERDYFVILDTNGRAWWLDNTGGTLTNNLIYSFSFGEVFLF